jgi:hypothetical protein
MEILGIEFFRRLGILKSCFEERVKNRKE